MFNIKQQNGDLYIVIGGEQYDSTAALLRESFIVRTIVRGLALAVVVAGIIGLILFALLTRRLHDMSRVVREFEKGNYQERIRVASNDEIGRLARAFNRMADTIVRNLEELKKTDDLRRELVANVSHDLRTPLASIRGYIETILMKEDSLTASERRHYLEIILKDTERLARLVQELFELSKLDAHQIELKPEPLSLAELTQDVVMKFRDMAEKLDIDLQAPVAAGLPPITADIGLLERALSNLIENALNYTPKNGTVRVEVRRLNGRIRTIVSDTGHGIDPREQPYIFDRFYKGSRTTSRIQESTGLGLAIAQKIMQLHGTEIKVESEPQKGSSFYFDLVAEKQRKFL